MAAEVAKAIDLAAEEWHQGRLVRRKTTSPEFKGQCEEPNGHVINCGQAKHTDQFSHTMKEVINYVCSKITDGEWVVRLLRHEKLLVITSPMTPTDPDDITRSRTELRLYLGQ
jgi:hypothetical protein